MENELLDLNNIDHEIEDLEDLVLQVDESEDQEEQEEQDENTVSDPIDYTEFLESINTTLENIEANQVVIIEDLQVIRDNSYRLYYFIGGLYIAFAIYLAIRFLKIFF